ncbi:putative nuclear RNA export factor SDE5 isoform X1 [Nicotiana tomentosiformis]|uniref:putative nuclear RNA export factor SDE5 isoform X1 n=2 Tax=Nicotiana tomentosiformis TaxID=4098 RepID=UPI00051B0D35|nr:putative nuclear RNA export factor SDE5 isoform X1 [Nicotiana tomentosiformis]XP_009614547.1 putative nuclear RNA export factor SDE5 isoform X1 [Nicotiana tomentosiformis]XP_009614548.1 putative nuclear RNA export factor SDE5 isoform X1 [Nicotiana tomentosiformis]XP_033514879.1 putative nuclear RNA export factor SDE5 isoform X1 [Nicotiana tomentosiformis]XP_033514880.1 putative nuclear RNA export factor SDE5 isoform X1 [Nicotiana tomentosiformis]XP_033514881.1 putative nuclear RNA export fa
MKMEAPPTVLFTDDDRKNLEQLLDVFGRVVSLDDIAAAYCKAGRDPTIAGDILGDLQASTYIITTSASEEKIEDSLTLTSESQFEEVGDSVTLTSESASEIYAKRAGPSSSKQKKLSVSMGTVSSMIPRDYVTNRPLIPETSTRIKPLKLTVDDFFTPEIRDEKAPLGAAAMSETLPGSVEEFLFKMLGDGFSLDMSVIEDVVGQCGYDLNKSMDKLLDLSASTLGKSDDILDIGVQKSGESPDFASVASQETPSMQDPTSRSKAKNMTKNGLNLSKKEKVRYEFQKEVLQTLFNVPARHDDVDDVIRHVREVEKSRRLSQFVVKPLQETVERQILIRTPQSDAKNGEENEESYEVLRKAVKEYWLTMKEYYKAAAEEFQKGDHVKARRFLEEGNFFMTKARETDEQSAQTLLENSYNKEIVTVDLHDFEPKEAVRCLKIQLTSLCGISSIQYLKIVVGITNEEAKGLRKRVIIKLLERASIAWTEEDNGKAIVIKADEIDPRKLTFAKKSTV